MSCQSAGARGARQRESSSEVGLQSLGHCWRGIDKTVPRLHAHTKHTNTHLLMALGHSLHFLCLILLSQSAVHCVSSRVLSKVVNAWLSSFLISFLFFLFFFFTLFSNALNRCVPVCLLSGWGSAKKAREATGRVVARRWWRTSSAARRSRTGGPWRATVSPWVTSRSNFARRATTGVSTWGEPWAFVFLVLWTAASAKNEGRLAPKIQDQNKKDLLISSKLWIKATAYSKAASTQAKSEAIVWCFIGPVLGGNLNWKEMRYSPFICFQFLLQTKLCFNLE